MREATVEVRRPPGEADSILGFTCSPPSPPGWQRARSAESESQRLGQTAGSSDARERPAPSLYAQGRRRSWTGCQSRGAAVPGAPPRASTSTAMALSFISRLWAARPHVARRAQGRGQDRQGHEEACASAQGQARSMTRRVRHAGLRPRLPAGPPKMAGAAVSEEDDHAVESAHPGLLTPSSPPATAAFARPWA